MENKKPMLKQMRYTDEEREILKNTFEGKEDLFKLLRKVFLVEYDVKAPLGQVIDIWLTIPTENQDPEQVLINLRARNLMLNHLEMCLRELWILANTGPNETPEDAVKRLLKDSTK